MQGRAVLIQQLQDVVDDLVLEFGEQVRLREGRPTNAGAGVLTAEFGGDVVEVLLHADALALQYLHNGGKLTRVRDGRLFEAT